MGRIISYGKWDLESDMWAQNPSFEMLGRSFSFARYAQIINNDDKINYIIVCPGCRVEDVSKDFYKVGEKSLEIDRFIKHYQNKNENYRIEVFLMDADAPIIKDAQLMAKHTDYLASLPSTGSINILGISKCSIMSFYVPRFFQNSLSFAKTNVYAAAAPYNGTKLASPLIIYKELKDFAEAKMPTKALAMQMTKWLIKLYESVSSNSHMDYDIAVPGGIPSDRLNLYDENFISNVFSEENVEAIKRINAFRNLVTGIDDDTLKEAIKTGDLVGIGLCILDSVFLEHLSDGMVYTSSQRLVEDVLDIKSYFLISSHHSITKNKRVLEDVLHVIDDTIYEMKDKQRVRRK